MDNVYHGTVVSSFNAQPLVNFLQNDINSLPAVAVVSAPFGQVQSYLLADSAEEHDDFLILWTQPDALIDAFRRLMNGEKITHDSLMAEVDDFARLVESVSNRYGHVLIPTWVLPTYHRCRGVADMRNGAGVRNALARMNLRLCDRFEHDARIVVLNTAHWIEDAGGDAFDPKLWYLAKMPFSPSLFRRAADECKTVLRAAYGLSRKLIIVDLDDTLWGGIVGDDGWEHLRIGGHDPVGEAYRDFQMGLKLLSQRGILLGIVSKNDEQTALAAMRLHPEMVLRQDDFAGWKINWNDKAENVRQLAQELRLGLQSVVFIDDNPVERARVAEALPDVEVPEWPSDPMLSARTLLQLPLFDTLEITEEDAQRTALYRAERLREQDKLQMGGIERWLESLHMTVAVAELDAGNSPRAVQLFNKTNQMNLSTRRMTERELVQWVKGGRRKLWVFTVSDKFGDSGLTGIASVELCDHKAELVDFLLSCRVMGRGIERMMVSEAAAYAREQGCATLHARLVPTQKNSPCKAFWTDASGFTAAGSDIDFVFDLHQTYDRPRHLLRLTGE